MLLRTQQWIRLRLIFRATWAISSHSKSFVRRIISKAINESSFDVVKDQVGVTTSTQLIAKVTVAACKSINQGAAWSHGIYHLVPMGISNRYEIVQSLLKLCENYRIPLKAHAEDVNPVTTDEYLTAAKRPLNSQLDTRKLRAKLSFDLPHWKDDFLAVASDIAKKHMKRKGIILAGGSGTRLYLALNYSPKFALQAG